MISTQSEGAAPRVSRGQFINLELSAGMPPKSSAFIFSVFPKNLRKVLKPVDVLCAFRL